MISPGVKKILSGVMIAGDILLGSVFFADLLAGTDPGLSLFLVSFLTVDGLLSLDYIFRLSKEEEALKKQDTAYRERNEDPKRRADREMAEDISSATEANDIDPQELAQILSDHKTNTTDTYQGRQQ